MASVRMEFMESSVTFLVLRSKVFPFVFSGEGLYRLVAEVQIDRGRSERQADAAGHAQQFD